MDSNTSWTDLPLFSSLTDQILLYGTPRMVLMINILITMIFIVNFDFYYIILITVPLQFFCIYLTKGDPQFFDTYFKYVGKQNYYST